MDYLLSRSKWFFIMSPFQAIQLILIIITLRQGILYRSLLFFLNSVAGPEGNLLKTFFVYFFEIFFQRKFLTAIHAVEGHDPSTDNQLDLPAAVSAFHIFNIT
jgi:hypothetical protein